MPLILLYSTEFRLFVKQPFLLWLVLTWDLFSFISAQLWIGIDGKGMARTIYEIWKLIGCLWFTWWKEFKGTTAIFVMVQIFSNPQRWHKTTGTTYNVRNSISDLSLSPNGDKSCAKSLTASLLARVAYLYCIFFNNQIFKPLLCSVVDFTVSL